MQKYAWETLLMFTMGPRCDKLGLSQADVFNQEKVFLAELIRAPATGLSEALLAEYLQRIRQRGRSEFRGWHRLPYVKAFGVVQPSSKVLECSLSKTPTCVGESSQQENPCAALVLFSHPC